MSDDGLREALARVEALLAAQLGLALATEREYGRHEFAEVRIVKLLSRSGFSQAEIAGMLGISQPTVSRRLRE